MFRVVSPQAIFRILLVSGGLLVAGAVAQDQPAQPPADKPANDAATSAPAQPAAAQSDPAQAKPAPDAVDPLTRPNTEKQKKKNQRALKQELSKPYKKWLEEDVVWIITDEERAAFKQLSNDEERDNFIEAFWQRRDPTPDTEENEYKEEHYQRIAYANEHFAAGVPGWKTDRGRMYIVFGKPDEIDSHPSGGTYERPMDEGGGETSTFPFEDWRYRYIEGIGQEVIMEFVDPCMCGEYHMTMDRSEKDALLMTPNAGLTLYEQMGMANKSQRFTGNGIERLGMGPESSMQQTKEFDRLEQFAKLQAAPKVKFTDLEEEVNSKVILNPMPFDVRSDFVKVTSDTVLVPIAIQMKNRDITFVNKDGIQRGTVNIFARLTTLTGKVVQTFEDTVQVDVPAELLPRTAQNSQIYTKALPLRPGLYKLYVAVKDVNGDRKGIWSRSIKVPEFSDDKLSTSSLVVADVMEPVPTKDIGTGNFVIGTTKVRPRVAPSDGKPAVFKRDRDPKLNFWMQVYNLGVDEKTHKPSATFEYDITNLATNKQVVQKTESTDTMGNVGEQVTLQKSIVAANLQPGTYKIEIKVNDNISKQTVNPSALFAVE
ncbi:MAG TPA: GWxTD domain-containing protein [Candidatus Sulfotelmatobacter sp.]|jgi:GWxTD domain-containing protein|nr:GWxTD domain-containing protein [Candidatus Sulfotelmatobacter sp.]